MLFALLGEIEPLLVFHKGYDILHEYDIDFMSAFLQDIVTVPGAHQMVSTL